ncbi:calcium and integrin-binding family member 2-like [Oscarella lobularis]|uniref:calcium and integrin-binding family member 2-like n=1 Tax=Oscarella lobularis TaxID=121494 RepID=UPI0033141DE0
MGATSSCGAVDGPLDRKKLEEYQNCTYFTQREIKKIFAKFKRFMENWNQEKDATKDRLPHSKMTQFLPELENNPFSKRICTVFSSDRTGNLSFDDFLDMMSVFSEAAPRDLKATYAFKIYDFDGDEYLDAKDLDETLKMLTKGNLEPNERETVIDKVFKEADLDDDGKLSFIEFEHVIARAPDFVNTFHIRII